MVASLPSASPGGGSALEAARASQQPEPPIVIVPVPAPAYHAASPEPAAAAPQPENLADAFAEFASTSGAQPAAGAVDITAIKPKRETAAPPPPPPPPPPPAKPKAPSRIWVQVATGKDLKALAFDWRKFGKEAPALLGKRSAFTAKWGETRRLLTGPVESDKAANKLVADLKKAGIDAFAFTSDEGEEVAPLK